MQHSAQCAEMFNGCLGCSLVNMALNLPNLACTGVCKAKIVKIRKMAAHGGLAFGKDSNQKMHDLKQEAQRKRKLQNKQHKRKKAKLQAS